MANVSFDTEFMKQTVPSMPISHAQAFQVVHDEESHPIIFSIGTGGSLFALLPDGINGQTLLLNLGTLFGLSTSSVVSSMVVLQDKDLVIYLTFAVDGAETGEPSTVYVVHPTKPTDWLAAFKDSNLVPPLLKDTSVENRLVKQLHIGGAANHTSGYPLVVVVYSELDGGRIDAAYVDINVSQMEWKYSDRFELPETPDNMIAMCAGALPAGINGLFCLYDSQGQKLLTFAGMHVSCHEPYSTSLHPPPGAECLATFVNKTGFTDLLMGGNAITHYTANDALHSDEPTHPDRFTYVTSDSDPYLKQLRQISIAQASNHDALTIYGRNGDDTIVYQQCNITSPSDKAQKVEVNGPSIPLLTGEQGGGPFTVLLDGVTGSQKLFIVGEKGTLTRMEQSGVSRLWQRISVLVPSAGKNKEITSYTSHIHIADQGGPITNAKFLLCSSSAIDLGSNGHSITATSNGVLVTTDQSGDITLIQNVTGLSTVVFTLKDDPHGARRILGKSHVLNPAMKVQRVLNSIKTSDDARNAKLPNGDKLLDHASASPDTVDKTVKALPLLCQALKQMPSNGKERKMRRVVKSHSSTPSASDISDWGIWEWVSNALGKVEKFLVAAGHLVVTFAGKVFRFLLKSLSHVLKAVHWLLQDVLGIPIDKIIEWLGFLFQWDDILETHDVISAMMNTGIDCAIAKVDDFATIVDDWFKKSDCVDSLKSLPRDVLDRKESRTSIDSHFDPQKTATPVAKTVGSNWSFYQLKHGGVGTSLYAQTADTLDSDNPLLQFWKDVAGPALEKIRETLEDAMKNIGELFLSSKELSFGQLLEHLSDEILHDTLGIIHEIVVGLIKFIADFASDVKVQINKNIDIPLLTPFYRQMTKGHTLTMLDAITLLIAVPTTIVYKALTGQKPADIDGVKEFMAAYKAHHSRWVKSHFPARRSFGPSNAVLLTFAKRRGGIRRGAKRRGGIRQGAKQRGGIRRRAKGRGGIRRRAKGRGGIRCRAKGRGGIRRRTMRNSATRIYVSEFTGDLTDLFAKLKKIASRVASYVMPVVNIIQFLMALDDWYTPEETETVMANGWKWKIPLAFIGAAFTYPYDDNPKHTDLHLFRQITWGLGTLSILATPAPLRIRGLVALATGCFQIVPEAVSIPMAISSAMDGSYDGGLDSDMVWVDIFDRLFALVYKGAGGVCMILNDPEPYSFGTASLTYACSIACQGIKVITYKPQQVQTGMPQASLYAL